MVVKRQFFSVAAALAAAAIAGPAAADSGLVDGLTPNLTVGFEFGAPTAPRAASRVMAAFNLNSRTMRPSLVRMGSPSDEVKEDVDLAGRGMPVFTVLDVSGTASGFEAAHAFGYRLQKKK